MIGPASYSCEVPGASHDKLGSWFYTSMIDTIVASQGLGIDIFCDFLHGVLLFSATLGLYFFGLAPCAAASHLGDDQFAVRVGRAQQPRRDPTGAAWVEHGLAHRDAARGTHARADCCHVVWLDAAATARRTRAPG